LMLHEPVDSKLFMSGQVLRWQTQSRASLFDICDEAVSHFIVLPVLLGALSRPSSTTISMSPHIF
jgi:hypothetical protein